MLNITSIALGLAGLIGFVGLRRPLKQLSPIGFFLLGWSLVCLTGGLSLVTYNELRLAAFWMILAHAAAFLLGLWMAPGKLFPAAGAGASAAVTGTRLPRQLLMLTRLICLGILIAYAARYYHIAFVQGRVIADIQVAYQMNQEANYGVGLGGSWFSRIGFFMFLWPLPASLLVWFYRGLSVFDRLLLGAASFGHAVYAVLQAGRSGVIFNLSFIVPLFLIGVFLNRPDHRHFLRRLRIMAAVGMGVAVVLLVLMVAFGIRTSNLATGRTFSESFELSPGVHWLMNLAGGSNPLTEGFAGAVGYVTQPVQRLSMFTDLDVNFRFYGAYNFDLFGNLLRRVGVGENNYRYAQEQFWDEYTIVADAPIGTFSTCIRDYYLDFGWLGILAGGILSGFLAQWSYRKVVGEWRWEYLPVLGFMFSHLTISPLFSGLQAAGANFSLVGSLVGFVILRRFLPRRQMAGAAAPRSTVPKGGNVVVARRRLIV